MYMNKYDKTEEDIDELLSPSEDDSMSADESSKTPEQLKLESEIKTKFNTIKQIQIGIEFFKYKMSDPERVAIFDAYYKKTTSELSSNLDKRFKVLSDILDITDLSHIELIKEHMNALKYPASKGNIESWCQTVKAYQASVIQLLTDQGKADYINMYKMFTTPFYCYVMYDIPRDLQERYKTLFSMLFGIIKTTDNFASVVHILMSDIHLFLNISTSIFRLLFNDGMLLASMLREPATIKTGCQKNTLELIREGILTEGILQKDIVVCLGCGEQIYQVEHGKSSELILKKKKSSACDHTMHMAPAFFQLLPLYYKENLLYLCKECNLQKSNIEIIKFLYKMFTSNYTLKNPEKHVEVDSKHALYRKNVYKKVFKRLSRHFKDMTTYTGSIELIESLELLKSTYDTHVQIKDTALMRMFPHVLTSLYLVEYSQQTPEQLMERDQSLKIIEKFIARRVEQDYFEADSDQSIKDIITELIEGLIANASNPDEIRREDMIKYFSTIGKQNRFKRDLSLRAVGLGNALMHAVDLNHDDVASIHELEGFFLITIQNIIQNILTDPTTDGGARVRYIPPTTGRSYNKGILGKKTKSKHTKKHKKYKKSKHTKKHKKHKKYNKSKKHNETKKYKKHKNNKSFKV